MRQIDHLRRIRAWITVLMLGLILSGITAFPLQTELEELLKILHAESTSLRAQVRRMPEELATE